MPSLFVELLERRRLLSTLYLTGTASNDVLSISMVGSEIQTGINGVVNYVSDSDFSAIVIDGLGGADQLHVQSNGENPVTVNGGAGSDSIFISSNAGNLETIDAPVFVDGGENGGLLTLYDDLVNQSDTYTITSTTISRVDFGGVSYSSLTSILLQSQGGNNVFNVESTPSFSITISGRNGDDTVHVTPGSQNLSAISGSMSFLGGGGNDSIYLHDSSNSSSDAFTIHASAVSRTPAGTIGFECESVRIDQGSGDNSTEILSFTQPSLHIDAGLGNDTITFNGIGPMTSASATGNQGNDTFNVETTIAGSQLQLSGHDGSDQCLVGGISQDLSGVGGGVLFDGGSGSDLMRFDDRFQTLALAYNFSNTSLATDFSGPMTYSNTEISELFAGEGQSTINLLNQSSSVEQRVYGNGGDDTINLAETVATVLVDCGEGQDALTVGNESGDSARARVIGDDELSDLTINTGGRLEIPIDVTIATTFETNFGTINFDRHAAHIARNVTLAQARSRVNAGYANGAWNGASSAYASTYSASSSASDGIGYARGSDLGINHYGAFSLGANDILFTQTLLGDATLDQSVNFNDLLRLAQNYNASNRYWSSGDFNYDGNVNFNDLLPLAQNYGATGIVAINGSQNHRIFSIIPSIL